MAYSDFATFVREFIGQDRLMETVHFRPQYLFLCRDQSAPPDVDVIGRFERFGEDFAAICARLGVDYADTRANSGRSRPATWREAYDP